MPAFPPLSFESFGPPGAPTIVFLHGAGVGSWMWNPVISLLPEYHCLAPDQIEHGSNRSIAPFSMESYAEKVAGLVRSEAHGSTACIIGLSEGAQVVVQLLASAPEVVNKAIVSSALLRPVPGMGWANNPALLAWAYRLSIPPFRNSDWWIRLNMKYAASVPGEFYPYFKKDFQDTTEAEFVNVILANQRFRLPAGLEKATAPTLVLAGKKEYGAMKQSVHDLASALPNATAGTINLGKGSSMAKEHNWALSAPALFAQTVRAWVQEDHLPAEIEI